MECDYHSECGKDATCNYQKVWVRYSLNKDGDYGARKYNDELNEDPSGDDNIHLCKEHEQKMLAGEI